MIRIQAILLLILTFLTAFPAHAEWGRTAHDYLDLPLPRGVSLCADGNGGCWATSGGVNACHVDRFGNFTWGDERFRILPEPGYNPKLALAENGDLILAMDVVSDDETGRVYLQRTNPDREFIWGEEGIQLDSSDENQGVFGVYAGPIDNTYLIHWARLTDLGIPVDGRLQLINEEGDFLWGNTGIGENEYYYSSKIVITSDHCVIVARGVDGDLRLIKIDSDGEQLWDSRFSPLGEYVRGSRLRGSESDRAGGTILVYEYLRAETIDDTLRRYLGVKAMRISGDGDSLWTRQVHEHEKEPRGDQFGEIMPIINYAGYGRFFVAWADHPRTFQVVALDIDGEFFWEEPVDIILNPGAYFRLDAADSDSGVCYTWVDNDSNRENGGNPQQHRGQRISLNGERLWVDRGRAIQDRSTWDESITTNGNGGVITVVEPGPTIQMINRNGEIGVVLPVGVEEKNDNQKLPKHSPKLNIYPNPGNSHFQIEFDTGNRNEMFSYSIYNLMGRAITTGMMMGAPYMVNDLSRFSSGEYILQIQSQRSNVSTRFFLVK